MTLWTFLAFALDAIAIAAQAIIGRALGAGDVATTRSLTRRMIQWGLVSGVVSGLLLAAASPWVGHLFSSDPAVVDLLTPVLLVAALGQPLAGVVFVLDGLLIGAGDGRYLAWAGLVALLAYTPLALVAGRWDLTWLWVAFAGGFMLARAAVLLRRARGNAWLVTGSR
jgi:Na+-driven multidrug efflux pump